ncbi:MAG: Tm-1-like ATP-binding domain-containing protein, partial [Terriglobia bacterium]
MREKPGRLIFSPERRIVVPGTLDTKGEEILFVKNILAEAGAIPIVVDVGVTESRVFTPDVCREEIATLGGASIEDLVRQNDRGMAVTAMEKGFGRWVRNHRDRIAGMLSIGGSGGTTIATAGMRELPIGIPKLMVSTLASSNTRPFVRSSDICMMYSVADFSGLNSLTRVILRNAAHSILGMTGLSGVGPPSSAATEKKDRPLVAATMFGVTTPCVSRVRELLEEEGFELLVFHANGAGGQGMEQLVKDGFVQGVLDITTTELADELAGGAFSAGPHRLEIGSELGVPQVISVGALDMVTFGPRSSLPEKFQNRTLQMHNANVTLMRTTEEENAELGRMIVHK